MEKINLANVSKITSPNYVIIICTKKPDGSTNLGILIFLIIQI